MSIVYQVTASWQGFSHIRRFVIFGDSYSAVGVHIVKRPSPENPFGISFPGITYNEEDQPNWVGHLITQFIPPPLFVPGKKPSKVYQANPVLVYDYARGGAVVDGVIQQVNLDYQRDLDARPTGSIWTAASTLYVTWVGINDLGRGAEPEGSINKLFTAQERLYDTGARNFLFFDLPPIHRCPAVSESTASSTETRFKEWNRVLKNSVEQFRDAHPDATVLLFSAWQTFEALLDEPDSYGFRPEDVKRSGGTIWRDHLHPTSKVHEHIANNVADFLGSMPGPIDNPTTGADESKDRDRTAAVQAKAGLGKKIMKWIRRDQVEGVDLKNDPTERRGVE